jgi:hypothetical protein
VLDQHLQHLQWLRLQPDSDSILAQLTGLKIDLIRLKRDAPEGMMRAFHAVLAG